LRLIILQKKLFRLNFGKLRGCTLVPAESPASPYAAPLPKRLLHILTKKKNLRGERFVLCKDSAGTPLVKGRMEERKKGRKKGRKEGRKEEWKKKKDERKEGKK
jgi:hypothetical protein